MNKTSTSTENNLIRHLTVRVAWHDNRWNGSIGNKPSENPYCLALDKIREARNDEEEDSLKNRFWDELKPEQLPPCIADSGGFMNEREWVRTVQHPYQDINKAAATHGALRKTKIKVPPFSTFAVPFAWMLRENQENIDDSLPSPLSPDEESPFNSSWVFGSERQNELLNMMFGKLKPERSLVFFYLKTVSRSATSSRAQSSVSVAY